jgi:hypothetical protein
MRNTVTVSQQYPSWAEAYEARERLVEEHGLDEHGIDQIEIERFGGRFELVVRTDEFHRDEIEHLLRSAGTPFNPPAWPERRMFSPPAWREPGNGLVRPLALLGAAALAGVAAYALFGPRGRSTRQENAPRPLPRATAATTAATPVGTPMFTLEVDGAPVAVTKGNPGEARAIFDGSEFRDKLRKMESDGRPLWNGSGRFTIRPASAAEIRAFVQYAETLGFEDEEEGDLILYLRPIDSPDEYDETQDG